MNDKIAIYLRLSLADGDLKKGSKDESNSIENQRMLLHDYIGKQEDLFGEIVEYVDDGYTGTNFNRPAFQKMIVDLKQGDIKVIMVKDLSRLGRDYIGVGDYIEQIFPLMGVRFIAVNNTFDSMKLNNGTPGIEVAVSNLVNNMYSRDIAKKVRAALETNWKNGKATCTNVPFGYVWNKKGGQRWEIDPEAAASVKKVFELALSGRNTTQIAYGMNELNLPTPGLYVVFAFVGAGSVLKTLEDYVAEHHMENVVFIPYQDKADLIYSLNAGDVHWCVNAKGIKGVSCPSKYYGLASAARPVIGVLESGSEIRCIIEDTKGGLCCEPGEYDKVEENIRWFIDNAGSKELKAMGARSRENLEKNLTRNVSVQKYAEEILKL